MTNRALVPKTLAVQAGTLVGVLCLGVIACVAPSSSGASGARASVARRARSPGRDVPEHAAHSPSPDERVSPLPPVELVEVPKWYRAIDPLSTYHFHPQVPPPGYRPLPDRIRGPFFPGSEFSEIWGYEVSATYAPNCSMLARNGTLCPNVVHPGKRLDEAQTKQLMSIAHQPLDEVERRDDTGQVTRFARSRVKTRCGDEPVAMFVFYDTRLRPVGVVGLDEDCSEWSLWPAPKDAWPGFALTQPSEQRTLSQLCIELDLHTCAPSGQGSLGSDARPKMDAERKALQQALLPLLLREWPAVDENKLVTEATPFEREQLCAWYARSAAIANSLFSRVGSWSFSGVSVEDEQGRTLRLQPSDECIENFPSCSGTIAAGRACIMRHLEKFWDRNETCHLDCVWGIKAFGIPAEP